MTLKDQNDTTEWTEQSLSAQLRELSVPEKATSTETLVVLAQVNQLLWKTLWSDEEKGDDELDVNDIITRADEFKQFIFAPWLVNSIQQKLRSFSELEDADCVHQANVLVSAVNGIAHMMFDANSYDTEPGDAIPKDEDDFADWWETVMDMTSDKVGGFGDEEENEDEDEGEDEDEDEENLDLGPEHQAFAEADTEEKFAILRKMLESNGVKVANLSDDDQSEIADPDYYFSPSEAFGKLLPGRYCEMDFEPFGCASEDEVKDFYPDLWRAAARATLGELKLTDLRSEGNSSDDFSEITVRFHAFGKEHIFNYENSGSWSDGQFLDDLKAFTKRYLKGQFVFDPIDNDGFVGYVYLPIEAANELKSYLAAIEADFDE